MRALVTGANGFIGSHLAAFLIDQGFTVRCLVRQESDLRWLKVLDVQFVYGDIRNRETLSQAVSGVDYIFHLAAVIRAHDWQTYNETNHIGTKNLIEKCVRYNPQVKRLVYVSSISAAGCSGVVKPLREEDECHPNNDYGKTKLLGEEVVRSFSHAIPSVIIRPPNVYGPREKEFYSIVRVIEKRIKPLFGNGEKQTTLCYVDDLIRGMLIAARSKKSIGETYYITDGNTYSYREITDEIARALGVSNFIVPLPHCALIPIVSLMQLYTRISHSASFLTLSRLNHLRNDYFLYSGQKAVRELGFRSTVSLSEGMRRSIVWYRENCMK